MHSGTCSAVTTLSLTLSLSPHTLTLSPQMRKCVPHATISSLFAHFGHFVSSWASLSCALPTLATVKESQSRIQVQIHRHLYTYAHSYSRTRRHMLHGYWLSRSRSHSFSLSLSRQQETSQGNGKMFCVHSARNCY